MELVFIVAILAPCALVAVLILVTVVRPTAAPALVMVLSAITEPLQALTRWFDNLSKPF
jgi:hypothetical protein